MTTSPLDVISLFSNFQVLQETTSTTELNAYRLKLCRVAADLVRRMEELRLLSAHWLQVEYSSHEITSTEWKTGNWFQETPFYRIRYEITGLDKLLNRTRAEEAFLSNTSNCTPQQLTSTNLPHLTSVYIALLEEMVRDSLISLQASESTGSRHISLPFQVMQIVEKQTIDITSSQGTRWIKVLWKNSLAKRCHAETDYTCDSDSNDSSDSSNIPPLPTAFEKPSNIQILTKLATTSPRHPIVVAQIVRPSRDVFEYDLQQSDKIWTQDGWPVKSLTKPSNPESSILSDIPTLLQLTPSPPAPILQTGIPLNLDPTALLSLISDILHQTRQVLEYAGYDLTNPDFSKPSIFPGPIVHQMESELSQPFLPRFLIHVTSHFSTPPNTNLSSPFSKNNFVVTLATWLKCGEIIQTCGGRLERCRARALFPSAPLDLIKSWKERCHISDPDPINSILQAGPILSRHLAKFPPDSDDYNAIILAHWTCWTDFDENPFYLPPPTILQPYFPLKIIEHYISNPSSTLNVTLPKLSKQFLESAWTRGIPTLTANTSLAKCPSIMSDRGVPVVFVEGCKTLVGKRMETEFDKSK